MKKFICLVTIMMMTYSVLAVTPSVLAVTPKEYNLTLTVGETINVEKITAKKYTITNENKQIVDCQLVWNTDSSVGYVITLKALQKGNTKITIEREDHLYIWILNITILDVINIYIPTSINMTIGDSYTYNPVIQDTGAKTKLSWVSTNPEVATVENGTVTAHAVGTTEIACTAKNGVTASSKVTVNSVLISNLSINYKNYELNKFEQVQLLLDILPEKGTKKDVIWSSTDPSVAIVDSDGLVIAIGSGTCVITATSTDGSNKSAFCVINVGQKNLIKGDVNEDGKVDISDIVSIINLMANQTE